MPGSCTRLRQVALGGEARLIHAGGEDHAGQRNDDSWVEPVHRLQNAPNSEHKRATAAEQNAGDGPQIERGRSMSERSEGNPARSRHHDREGQHDPAPVLCPKHPNQDISDQDELSDHSRGCIDEGSSLIRPAKQKHREHQHRRQDEEKSPPRNEEGRVRHVSDSYTMTLGFAWGENRECGMNSALRKGRPSTSSEIEIAFGQWM